MSQVSDSKTVTQEEALTIENILSIAKDVDRIMLEAVEAGMESGRSVGVLEAYNLLILEGHSDAAEILMQLIEEKSAAYDA